MITKATSRTLHWLTVLGLSLSGAAIENTASAESFKFAPRIQVDPQPREFGWTSIAIDGNGVIYSNYGSGGGMYFTLSTDAGFSFKAPGKFIGYGNYNAISADTLGHVYTVLESSACFNRSTDGGKTFEGQKSPADGAWCGFPQVASDDLGGVFVTRHGSGSIYIDVSHDFGASFPVHRHLGTGSPASDVATDGLGNVYVVYGRTDYGDPQVYFTRSTDSGDTWSTPVLLGSFGSCLKFWKRPAVTAVGNRVYVAWTRGGKKFDVVLRSSVDHGTHFGPEVIVNGPTPQPQAADCPPNVGVAGEDDHAYLAWGTREGTGKLWLASSRDGGLNFDRPALVDPTDDALAIEGGAAPSIATKGGQLFISWNIYSLKTRMLEGYFTRTLPFSRLMSPGDSDADGSPELAVLAYDTASRESTVEVKSATTGALVKQLQFNGQFVPKSFVAVPDLNGNGAQEIAVLGIRDTDQAVQVEVRDSLSGVELSTLGFSEGFAPKGLKVLLDSQCSGNACMALLQQDAATPGVQIRDALSGALVRDIPFSSGHAGIGFSVIADLNANSARELALLSDTKGPAIAHQIEIRDSSTGELIHTLNFPAGQRVRSLFKLPDLNENDSHELVTLHPELHEFGVMDSQTGAELNSIETALTEPLFTGTQTSIGSGTRLAVLGRSDPDGQIRAEVYNSLTSAIVNTIAFDQSGVTVSFRAIPDINGNGSSELVRLRAQAGPPALVAEIRDGGTGELLNTIGF